MARENGRANVHAGLDAGPFALLLAIHNRALTDGELEDFKAGWVAAPDMKPFWNALSESEVRPHDCLIERPGMDLGLPRQDEYSFERKYKRLRKRRFSR